MKLLITTIIIVVGCILWSFIYVARHPCIKSHREMVYHPSTYILQNNVMVPIGGGMWEDDVCDERK